MWGFIELLLPIILPLVVVIAAIAVRRQPLWAEAYRRLGRNKVALAALAIIAAYTAVGVLDSIKWKDNKAAAELTVLDRLFAGVPQERTYSRPLARETTGEVTPRPLTGRHVLGTDGVGKDVLYQTLKGCRTALILGGLTTVIATPLALLFGLMAGYYGRWVDDLIQYLYTVISSIPNILLLIAMMLMLGRGIDKLALALGVTSWVTLCRLTRGEVLKHRDRDYVRAARALGVSHGWVLLRHMLPNILPVVMISITLNLSSVMLAEAILSYLQLGVPAGVGSWGNMIDAARLELARDPVIWWNIVSASTALFVLVLAFNVFGDALRDAIDPRLRSA